MSELKEKERELLERFIREFYGSQNLRERFEVFQLYINELVKIEMQKERERGLTQMNMVHKTVYLPVRPVAVIKLLAALGEVGSLSEFFRNSVDEKIERILKRIFER